MVLPGTTEKNSMKRFFGSGAGAALASSMACASDVNCRPSSLPLLHPASGRHGALHSLVIVRERHVDRNAQELFDLLRRDQRAFRATIQQHADPLAQIQLLQIQILLARQVQRRNLRRAHQENALGFVHDLERISLQVARHVEAQRRVVAPHELHQMADLRRLDAEIRIQLAGVQHVQLVDGGHHGRPQALVHLERMLGRVRHAIRAVQLQHEPHHARVQVEVREQHRGVRHARHRHRRVHRDRGRSHARFGRQEAENLIGGLNGRRTRLHRILDPHQRIHQRLAIERQRSKLANPGPHHFQQNLRIDETADRDNLNARRVLLYLARDLHRLGRRLGADENYLRRVRAQKAQQFQSVRIPVECPRDAHNPDLCQYCF